MDKILFIEESGIPFVVEAPSYQVRESSEKLGHMILKGVPASVIDVVNGNDRKYSTKEIKKSIAKAKKEGAFTQRKLLCTADNHPEESFVPPAHASHIVLDAYTKKIEDKTFLMNDWLVMDTTAGKNLQGLIKAGASFGTSIRGLGQLNEETKEVENYDFLGCDAVGNPSAGTFASKEQFKVTVESAPSTLIHKVKEQLEGRTMQFNLQEAISQFKVDHFTGGKPPSKVTQKMTADLLSIQREAVENSVDVSDIEVLSDEIFGEASKPTGTPNKLYNQDENRDVANRAARELEATKNLAVDLQGQVKTLEGLKVNLKKEISAYEKVAMGYEKVAVALYDQVEDLHINGGKDNEHETKKLLRKTISTINSLQLEAKKVITGLEEKLETSIRIGDSAMDTAIVLRRIADSLYVRQVKQLDENSESWKHSRTMTSRMDPTRPQDPKKNDQGDRRGWY